MGIVSSRLNLDSFYSGRQRSQQDETLFNYSMNKNYFSNHFLMGGELFEVNNPDYLFGDNCDLNFLSCTKPYSLPYKQAQQNLLAKLSSKQKAINKCSNRVNRLGSTFNLLDCRQRRRDLNSRKQDAQTQTLHNSTRGDSNGSEPSRTIVMLVNIRKETLRLVKSATVSNPDSELNSLTNSASIIALPAPPAPSKSQPPNVAETPTAGNSTDSEPSTNPLVGRGSTPGQSQQQKSPELSNAIDTPNEHPATVASQANDAIHCAESNALDNVSQSGISAGPPANSKRVDPEMSSLISATSSIRSGYTSVGEDVQLAPSVGDNSSSSDDDEEYKDALNDATNMSLGKGEDNDNDSEKTQQAKSLLGSDNRQNSTTKENRDIKITIGPLDNTFDEDYSTSASNSCDIETTATITKNPKLNEDDDNGFSTSHSTPKRTPRRRLSFSSSSLTSKRLTKLSLKDATEPEIATKNSSNRIYNIEFNFDAEVDCTIRIFYFCTREITSAGVTYKPQHATYKSKIYYYKKGLNQKFDQQEHNFQPYLFDEDLLIYKPLDLDGNYNSGAVFPIVIQCIATEGPKPRQSHSLVATIEKSQLDDSYSIKTLKQLIFVDGVQYILQDIYGIEHKQIGFANPSARANDRATAASLRAKSRSFQSDLNTGSQLNLNDAASMTSVDLSLSSRSHNRGSLISQRKSLTGENASECVICMSEERDTMLLPCRHLCLCSTCAQSLRYQANSCPICRCPFKASLNLRPIHRNSQSTFSIA